MNFRKLIISTASLILVLSILILPIWFVPASAQEYGDYSKEGSFFNKTLGAGDIVELYLGGISSGERDYLNKYGDIFFKYEEVTSQQITVINKEGLITVIAMPYSYTTVSGGSATWIPVEASVGEERSAFIKDGDSYYAALSPGDGESTSGIKVEYRLDIDFVVCASEMNRLLNMAYENAPGIKEAYDSAKAEYDADKLYYDNYYLQNSDLIAKYNSDIQLYEKYLSDKELYDAEYAVYLDYLDEIKVYERELEEYEAYEEALEKYNLALEAQLEYDIAKEKYDKENEKYLRYEAELILLRRQLSDLEAGLYTSVTSLNRQLYSAIFSSLADQVIREKELFVNTFKVDPDIIDDCEAATYTIRNIINDYASYTEEADKYRSYITNYAALRDNIILLTQSLEAMYKVEKVRDIMHSQGKTEKFVIFISQLILFSNMLSDEPVYSHATTETKYLLNSETQISYLKGNSVKPVKNTPIELLEGNEYIKDSDSAAPLEGGYPAPVEKPEEPAAPPEAPDRPDEVKKPIEPTRVEKPADLPVVLPPVRPDGYTEMPVRPEILENEEYISLIAALLEGDITEREKIGDDYTFSPEKTLEKRLLPGESVSVTFLDASGDKLSTVTVDKGSSANFFGELPEKAEDIGARYSFSHWSLRDGTPFDLSAVMEDAVLKPVFTPELKPYTLKDGYIVIEDITAPLSVTELTHWYPIANENKVGIKLVGSDLSLSMSYYSILQSADELPRLIVCEADLSVSNRISLLVRALYNNEEELQRSDLVEASIPCENTVFATLSDLTYEGEDGELMYLAKQFVGGEIKFKLGTGTPYLLAMRKNLTIVDRTELADVSFDRANVVVGDTVKLSVTKNDGVKLTLYYYNDKGEKCIIDGDSFVMPEHDVYITVHAEEMIYTVTFISDGKVISRREYPYGSIPEAPKPPTKPQDESFVYTFRGWSSEISEVKEDITYTAVFDKAPAPVVEKPKGKYYPLLVAGIVTASVIGTGAVGGVTAYLVIKHKRKLKEASVTTDTASLTDDTDIEP